MSGICSVTTNLALVLGLVVVSAVLAIAYARRPRG